MRRGGDGDDEGGVTRRKEGFDEGDQGVNLI